MPKPKYIVILTGLFFFKRSGKRYFALLLVYLIFFSYDLAGIDFGVTIMAFGLASQAQAKK